MLRLNIPAQGLAIPPEEKDRAPLGRPTAERANLLATNVIGVASELMLRHGYDGTSLDLIAANAGVTKRTIYAKFGSKKKLLEQVLLQAALPATQAFASTRKRLDLHARLCDFGSHVLTTLLEPDMIRWLRFIASELSRRPELVIYVHPLIDQHNRLIQDVLESLIRDGLWHSDDPAGAAYFFSALITEPAKRYAFFAVPPGSKKRQQAYVDGAVRMFLAGSGRK